MVCVGVPVCSDVSVKAFKLMALPVEGIFGLYREVEELGGL
jgi:hypothetical protein